jgi:hypothetical protein
VLVSKQGSPEYRDDVFGDVESDLRIFTDGILGVSEPVDELPGGLCCGPEVVSDLVSTGALRDGASDARAAT